MDHRTQSELVGNKNKRLNLFLFALRPRIRFVRITTISLIHSSQQTQNICMTIVQCWINVEDVGPTLYNNYCYTNVLCLLGYM